MSSSLVFITNGLSYIIINFTSVCFFKSIHLELPKIRKNQQHQVATPNILRP